MAFQVLYSANFLQEDNVDKYLNMVDHFGSDQDQKLGEKALEFAKDLIKGTLAHIEELDNTIQSHSKNWRLNRIAKVELTILRLSIYEMFHRDDVPPKVAINEAVELAKAFGDENSKKFINGILDAVAKTLEKNLQNLEETNNGQIRA
ncbi:transcription antitermination factor NusB [Desulfothermus okinawensis JCM 13304]